MPNDAANPYSGLMPGANTGGSQQAVPSPAGGSTPAMGGANNPFLPGIPGGGTQPGQSSPYGSGGGLGDFNLAKFLGLNLSGPSYQAFLNAFKNAGYAKGVGQQLWNFLASGGGFSPQIAQGLIGALAPQRAQDTAQLMSQFGSHGLSQSSPAAYGLASLDAEYQSAYGGILAQMAEQAIQNYMNVLLAGKRETAPPLSGTQQFATVAGGIGAILTGLGANKKQ